MLGLDLFGADKINVDTVESLKGLLMILGVLFIVFMMIKIVLDAIRPGHNSEDMAEKDSSEIVDDKMAKLLFDPELSVLTFGNKSCDIPRATLMYFVCQLAFKNHRKAVKEIAVLDLYDDAYTEQHRSPSESKRAVYDAVRRINNLAEEKLGIKGKIIKCSGGSINIDRKYQ